MKNDGVLLMARRRALLNGCAVYFLIRFSND